MNHTVGPYDLKLHNPDESRLPRGLEVPYESPNFAMGKSGPVAHNYLRFAIATRDYSIRFRYQVGINSLPVKS